MCVAERPSEGTFGSQHTLPPSLVLVTTASPSLCQWSRGEQRAFNQGALSARLYQRCSPGVRGLGATSEGVASLLFPPTSP